MSVIIRLIPDEGNMEASALAECLKRMRNDPRPVPFAPELLKLTGDVSQNLLNDPAARRYPEVQTLGFWLRPAALEVMKKEFIVRAGCAAVPQGVVFHIPPSNVDTMFAYSLFMSLLCGNANIVRMPSRRGAVAGLLVNAIRAIFQKTPFRDSLLILDYDHDAALTEIISRHADLRVIWGGDETVKAIRAIPLAPWGRELVFPNRFSWMAIDINAYRALKDDKKEELAEKAFNDLFWFDQNGCASPRMIIWRGNADAALADDFYRLIAGHAAQKGWNLETGSNIQKQARHYDAMADYPLSKKKDFDHVLTVFSLAKLNEMAGMRDHPCFGGTLFEHTVNDLTELLPFIERRDQTLTIFGFTLDEIEKFAREANGRGFDRIVPVGQALAFDAVWDGYDLPHYFTRLVRTGVKA